MNYYKEIKDKLIDNDYLEGIEEKGFPAECCMTVTVIR